MTTSLRGRRAATLWASLVMVVAALACGPALAEPLAAGLIVKLKDPASAQVTRQSAASVVRLQAAALPADGASAQTQRAALALSRQAVAYHHQRPTAFAARAVRFEAPRAWGDAQRDAARLRAHPDVEWVVVDELLQPAALAAQTAQLVQTQTEPDAGQQVWLQAAQAGREGVVNAPAAWQKLAGRIVTPAVVAVLDSGVPPAADAALADLQGRLLPGYDFVSTATFARDGNGLDGTPTDEGNGLTAEEKQANKLYGSDCAVRDSDWHGLGVTYMLAGAPGNGRLGLGMLAHVSGPVVLPVRVAGVCGAALSDLIEGMLWAAGVRYNGDSVPGLNPHPARVLNVSFGSQGSCMEEARGSVGALMRDAITTLVQKGVLVVASAGNGDGNGHGLAQSTRPANCPGVLAVTGLGAHGEKASYANFINGQGKGLAVFSGQVRWDGADRHVREGEGIATLWNQGLQKLDAGGYQLHAHLVGTSFASPQVAAVAAMMLSVNPGLSLPQLLAGLTTSVRPFPLANDDNGNPYPLCEAGQTTTCNCTASTCGEGVLDAGLAVDWAAGETASGWSDTTIVSSFQPVHDAAGQAAEAAAAKKGGGAVSDGALAVGLLWLLAILVWPQRRTPAVTPGRR